MPATNDAQKNPRAKRFNSKNESGAEPTNSTSNETINPARSTDDWLQAEEEIRRAKEEAIDKR